MTLAEHRLLLLVLAWILVSVPVALLLWQVWFRPRPVHPVIPHEDTLPAGSFLDVALPPPLPDIGERGIAQRRAHADRQRLDALGIGFRTVNHSAQGMADLGSMDMRKEVDFISE